MKTFVLGSLLLAATTTGCIITDDGGEEDARITAEWSFKTLNPSGTLGCPAGFGTVALYNQELDAQDRPIGSPVIDLFACDLFRSTSAPLAPGVYESWLEVTDRVNNRLYTASTRAIVDVRDQDRTFSATFYEDAGYFALSWDLRRTTDNTAMTCADDPELDKITIDSTLQGPNLLKTDKFPCEDGSGVTPALLEGNYGVAISATRDSDGRAIGPLTTLTTKAIQGPNKVTDLGNVIVKIDQ